MYLNNMLMLLFLDLSILHIIIFWLSALIYDASGCFHCTLYLSLLLLFSCITQLREQPISVVSKCLAHSWHCSYSSTVAVQWPWTLSMFLFSFPLTTEVSFGSPLCKMDILAPALPSVPLPSSPNFCFLFFFFCQDFNLLSLLNLFCLLCFVCKLLEWLLCTVITMGFTFIVLLDLALFCRIYVLKILCFLELYLGKQVAPLSCWNIVSNHLLRSSLHPPTVPVTLLITFYYPGHN